MQAPLSMNSTNFQYSSKPEDRYPLYMPADHLPLGQKEQMSLQVPFAQVRQYGHAYPAPPAALEQPLGVDEAYPRDYSLLERREQVGWQPPVPHVQKYGSARPAPTIALDQPSGLDTVHYRPTMGSGVVARYSASPAFPSRDTKLVMHTHASHSNQPVSEFISNNCENWTLTLDVPIPEDVVRPTLTSFSYTVKYSTANDHLASVVRSNILLATTKSEAPDDDDDETSESANAVCLSSVLGVKANHLDNHWNHFVDHQHIPFDVRIVPNSRLYLQIHVSEYPTEAILRSLSMDVFATWVVDKEEMRLLQKRQARQAAEAQKAADEEEANEMRRLQDRQFRQAAEEQEEAEAQKAADEAKKAAEAQKAADEAKQAAEAQKAADEAKQAAEAQKAADEAKQAAEAQKAADEAKQAAEAQKVADELAKEVAERDAKVGSTADGVMQEKIRKALERLPEDRSCPGGYVWVQNSAGFMCGGGGHSITWEELAALAD